MFLAKKINLQESVFKGEILISKLELVCKTNWFICEVPEIDGATDEIVCISTFLVPNVIDLARFSTQHKPSKVYLLSPGYLNETTDWHLDRLTSVCSAEYHIDDQQNEIFRFVTETGKTIIEDNCGLSSHVDNLEFKRLMVFN